MSQRGREKKTKIDLNQYGVEVLTVERDHSPSRPGQQRQEDLPPTPDIFQDMSLFLKEKGHICVMFVKPPHWKFKWCQQDQCIWKEAHNRQNTLQSKAAELKAQGHTCIQWRESFPAQLVYCEQEPCQGLKQ